MSKKLKTAIGVQNYIKRECGKFWINLVEYLKYEEYNKDERTLDILDSIAFTIQEYFNKHLEENKKE